MKILKMKVVFNGLYEWGGGFVSHIAAEKWDNFWKNWRSCFWRTVFDNGSTFIVSVGGGGMIHPMDFEIVLKIIGTSNDNDCPEYDELKKACEKAAAICGGSAVVESEIREI